MGQDLVCLHSTDFSEKTNQTALFGWLLAIIKARRILSWLRRNTAEAFGIVCIRAEFHSRGQSLNAPKVKLLWSVHCRNACSVLMQPTISVRVLLHQMIPNAFAVLISTQSPTRCCNCILISCSCLLTSDYAKVFVDFWPKRCMDLIENKHELLFFFPATFSFFLFLLLLLSLSRRLKELQFSLGSMPSDPLSLQMLTRPSLAAYPPTHPPPRHAHFIASRSLLSASPFLSQISRNLTWTW